MVKQLIATLLLCGALMACGGKSEKDASAKSADATKTTASSNAGNDAKSDSKSTSSATNRKGRLIYKQYCVLCHGADGKLAVSDAKDLSVSTISMEERINQITNGKGLMTPYKDILSEDQIQAVAEYLDELKK